MKSAILLLVLSVVVFSSCTTAYKTGQTPDDVYYSPARPQEEYVQSEKRDDQYRYSDEYYEDRYLRMKVSNRYRWRDLDDWYNADHRFRYNVYTGCCFCNDPWTPQVYWNSYYNPYYSPYYNHYSYGNVKTVAYNKPRTFNLNTYTPAANNTKQSNNKFRTSNNNTYTETRNNNSNSGNMLRNIFNGNNSGGNKNNSNTSSGSSGNNNSSSSGSTPSSAPVRRF